MWFHLSKTKWAKEEITDLRQTELGCGEPDVRRFSIAPTIGQAFLACPHAKECQPQFIYQVHVQNPERTSAPIDHETTGEHLITEAVLANEGGRIRISLVGQVIVAFGERLHLLLVFRDWHLEMTHDEEKRILWDVRDDVWRFCELRKDEIVEKLAEMRNVEAA